MAIQPREIPLSRFLYGALLGNLAYGLPTIACFVLFDLMETKTILFIAASIALFQIPITAALTWLMAKGSNWVNSSSPMIVACSVPAMLYGLLGAALCYRLFSTPGGAIATILILAAVVITRIPVGKFITRKLLSTALTTMP